jgi:hypothetical protein
VDKNLKAELLALRNEMLANLKNIEDVVGKIDTKLQDEDASSCLSRCPEIGSLLDQCRNVRWHPETENRQIYNFNKTVDRIHELLSVVQVERYTDAMAAIVNIARRMDKEMGKMPAKTAMETYWDSIRPGATDEHVERLYETKIKEGDIKAPSVPADDAGVKDALNKLSDILHNDEVSTIDTALAPEWAKDIDNKSMKQILKEASAWDEMAHELFVTMWNNIADRRVKLVNEALQMVAGEIARYNHHFKISVNNIDEAKAVMDQYADLDEFKKNLISMVTGYEPDVLARIGSEKNSDNFVRFYDWMRGLMQAVANAETGGDTRKQDIRGRAVSTLRALLQQHEYDVYECKIIDPQTFDFKVLTDAQISSYRSVAYNKYRKDLESAYAWLAKKKAEEATEQAQT